MLQNMLLNLQWDYLYTVIVQAYIVVHDLGIMFLSNFTLISVDTYTVIFSFHILSVWVQSIAFESLHSKYNVFRVLLHTV